jgi:hypothetical protein
MDALGDEAVAAWRGAAREDRDIQWGDVAVEVKTTVGDQPVTVAINDERQLDGEGFRKLFLVALTLDERADGGGGQTLNELVDELGRSITAVDARLGFRDRLLQYGWAEIHRNRYDRVRYVVRQVMTYRVSEGFPRLVESDLPPGVGKVRYLLALSACEPWRVGEEDVIAALRSERGL